jgi:hypothetical protein
MRAIGTRHLETEVAQESTALVERSIISSADG